MKYIFLLIFSIAVPFSLSSQEPETEWVIQYSGAGASEIKAIIADDSGNVYATGLFDNIINFEKGGSDISFTSPFFKDGFVTKTDRCGNLVWAKHYSGSSQVYPYDIKLDKEGNVYTTGSFNAPTDFEPGTGENNVNPQGGNAIYITKHDVSGKLIWVKRLGGTPGMYYPSIAVSPENEIIISGFFSHTADFDPGPGEFKLSATYLNSFIVKLDASGNFVWAKQFGGHGDVRSYATAVDKNGNVFNCGTFSNEIDFDPGNNEFKLTSNNNKRNFFISKLDKNGNFVWVKQFKGNDNNREVTFSPFTSIYLDLNDNVYMSGSFEGIIDFDPGPAVLNLSSNGNRDIFISKLDNNGNLIWVRQIGGTEADFAYAIAVDTDENVFCTGAFKGTVDFNPGSGLFELTSSGNSSAYIVKLNKDGNFVRAGMNRGNGAVAGNSIALAEPVVYTAGYFTSNADFGTGKNTHELTADNQSDGYIQKLSTLFSRDLINNNDTFICEGTSLKITTNPLPGDYYLWSTSETTNSISVHRDGTYHLTVQNCTHTFEDSIKIQYYSEEECATYLYVPNAFSPNSDGSNDNFNITGQNFANFELQIFNRWGQMVYTSSDMQFNWDGTFNGKICPDGIYLVYIQYETNQEPGKTLLHKSSLQLIR